MVAVSWVGGGEADDEPEVEDGDNVPAAHELGSKVLDGGVLIGST